MFLANVSFDSTEEVFIYLFFWFTLLQEFKMDFLNIAATISAKCGTVMDAIHQHFLVPVDRDAAEELFASQWDRALLSAVKQNDYFMLPCAVANPTFTSVMTDEYNVVLRKISPSGHNLNNCTSTVVGYIASGEPLPKAARIAAATALFGAISSKVTIGVNVTRSVILAQPIIIEPLRDMERANQPAAEPQMAAAPIGMEIEPIMQ